MRPEAYHRVARRAGIVYADRVPRRALALAAAAAAALACAGVRAPPAGLDDPAARETLRRFALDLEEGRFEDAARLLSSRWRAAYSTGRLALDFGGAGPAAREMAQRVLAALRTGTPIALDGARASLPLEPQRAAVLVAEGGRWRVDALE